jgi:oligopeptide/dipeptide ABC transporter ATP-binding protein
MGLIDPPGRIEAGSAINFEGRDLLRLPEKQLRGIRGNRIAMIFQEPMTALNPVFSIGDQVAEVARIHGRVPSGAAWKRAVEMLEMTGIPDAAERAREYPHQLSGGMRQRVLIAMALMMNPALIIADEPTTALDVTIQAQVLELLRDLQRRTGTAILLITHDLGVIAETADRVAVMYAGQIVEESDVRALFREPHHPYTRGLMAAIPRLESRRHRLRVIKGTVPPPTSWPSGCRFHDRCEHEWEQCRNEDPALYPVAQDHTSRCFLVQHPERRDSLSGTTGEGMKV